MSENSKINTSRKVSIVVPVYKSEAFLDKLIESMLNQTYTNLEIILVDDGSPDNSGQICDKYAELDNRVKVIHKKNGGTCEARNVGLEQATGELLMFADGDDWFELDCVEYLTNLLNKYGAEMAMTDAIFTTRNRVQNDRDIIKEWTNEDAVCGILYVDIPVGPWNKIYTTSVVKKNNLTFSVPWFGEGLYFSVMAAQHSNKVIVGHRKIYNYRLNNPNSGTTVRDVQHSLNALNNIKYIKKNLIVKTQRTIRSADWHIWRNYFNVIVFIVGANSVSEHNSEYKKSKKALRKMMMPVFCNSEVSPFQKAFILGASLFPDITARMVLSRKKRLFKKDRMK